jgi:hypothetical protein
VTSGGDPVRRVQASVATTKAQRTARLRYAAGLSWWRPSSFADALAARHHPAADKVKRIEGTLRVALSPERVPSIRGPEGQIDFENQRSLYGHDKSNLKLHAPGRSYVGEPGEWYVADKPDELWVDDPFWLLAILEATVEAVAQGDEAAGGTPCHLYTGFADFDVAGAIGGRVVNPPPPDGRDLSRMPIEVWLDDAGRIRRALRHGIKKSVTQIEMWAFGAPDPIELPPPGKILPG